MFADFSEHVFEATGWQNWILVERVFLQPHAKVRLNLNTALFVHFGNCGLDENDVSVETDVLRAEATHFASFPIGSNSGE